MYIIYLIIDLLMIVLCLYLPYIFKYNPDAFQQLSIRRSFEALWLPDLGQHSLVFLFWGILLLLLLRMYNLYTTDRTISYLDEAILTGKAIVLALLPAAAAVFFLQIKIFSREVFIIQTSSLFVMLIGWRLSKRYLVRRRVAKGFNNQHPYYRGGKDRTGSGWGDRAQSIFGSGCCWFPG